MSWINTCMTTGKFVCGAAGLYTGAKVGAAAGLVASGVTTFSRELRGSSYDPTPDFVFSAIFGTVLGGALGLKAGTFIGPKIGNLAGRASIEGGKACVDFLKQINKKG